MIRSVSSKLKKYGKKLLLSTKRFWMANIYLVILALALSLELSPGVFLENVFVRTHSFLDKMTFFALAMVFASALWVIFWEWLEYRKPDCKNLKIKKIASIAAATSLIGVLCFAGYTGFLSNYKFNEIYLGVMLIQLISLVMFSNNGDLGRHCLNLLSKLGSSFLMAFSSFLLGSLIILTISFLFSVDIDYRTYITWAYVNFVVFWGSLFLAQMTTVNEQPPSLAKIYRWLIFYVVSPFLYAYTVILYAYIGKIILIGEMPNNVVGGLVSWYMLVAVITVFLIYRKLDTENEFQLWVGQSMKYFIIFSVLPIGLLFYSVYIRISHYGFTVKRYWLLMGAVFSVLALLQFFIRKNKAQRAVFVTLISVIAIGSFGYFSAGNVTLRSQHKIFAQEIKNVEHSYKGSTLVIGHENTRNSQDPTSEDKRYMVFDIASLLLHLDSDKIDFDSVAYNDAYRPYASAEKRHVWNVSDSFKKKFNEGSYLLSSVTLNDSILVDTGQGRGEFVIDSKSAKVTVDGEVLHSIDFGDMKQLRYNKSKKMDQYSISSKGNGVEITLLFSRVDFEKLSDGSYEIIHLLADVILKFE